MHAAMLQTIEEALIEAGHLALKNQQTATHEQKADKSIVTTGDLAVSKMLSEKLAPWLEKPGHIWIDEERLHLIGTPTEVLGGQYEYVWVSDPIDGTAPYANGRNTWGHILGVAQNGKLFMGGVALPSLNILIVTNGQDSFLIKDAWSSHAVKSKIELPKLTLAPHIFFEINRPNMGAYIDALEDDLWISMNESAVSGQAYAMLGKSAGQNVSGYWSIWDITGAACVFAALGMPYKNRKTGEIFTLKPENFNDKWKLQGDWLACNPALYAQLDALLKKAE